LSGVPPQLLCTVRTCHEPLVREELRAVCPRGHSFDVARSGYVNLLQPQDRRAAVPGDRVEAVAARRRFLDRGHAAPIASAVHELATGESILDAGCGEGYYLGSLAQRGSGIDISTAAIELAAKRYPQCQWIVANADRFIPYADRSFDVVMSITGRLNSTEFRRVLKDDGKLIVAVAAPDDLIELRGRPNRDRLKRTIEMFESFTLIEQRRVTTQTKLTGLDASDLATLTYRPDVGRRAGPRPATSDPRLITLSLDILAFTPL
jgi:23S rRNA (guanine745-N1)-methyltransferase